MAGVIMLVGGLLPIWAVLLLALGRGAFVIPTAEAPALLRKTARVSLLGGVPTFFVLSMIAGQLTNLIPLRERAWGAFVLSLVTLPVYAMLVAVATVQKEAQPHRRRAGLIRYVSKGVIGLISLLAAFLVLGFLVTSTRRYFAP